MTEPLALLFVVRFPSGVNPPRTCESFTQSLRDEFLRKRGLDVSLGGMGGSACSYGIVSREHADVTLSDREDLANWIRQQRVACEVQISELKPEDQISLKDDPAAGAITFTVDNLTEEDRQAAEDYRQEIQRKIAEFKHRPGSSDTN